MILWWPSFKKWIETVWELHEDHIWTSEHMNHSYFWPFVPLSRQFLLYCVSRSKLICKQELVGQQIAFYSYQLLLVAEKFAYCADIDCRKSTYIWCCYENISGRACPCTFPSVSDYCTRHAFGVHWAPQSYLKLPPVPMPNISKNEQSNNCDSYP